MSERFLHGRPERVAPWLPLPREGVVFRYRKQVSVASKDSADPVITRAGKDSAKRVFTPDLSKLEAGDQQEWSQWVVSKMPSLRMIAQRKLPDVETAANLVQETWLKMNKRIAKGGLENTNLNGYITITLINLINSYYRKEEMRKTFVNSDLLNNIMADIDIEAAVVHSVFLRGLVDELLPTYREQIGYFVEDVPLQTIANNLNISVPAVKGRRISKSGEKFTEEQRWLYMIDVLPVNKLVVYLRQSMNITQYQLVERIGISLSAVEKIEAGTRSPQIDTANKLITLLPFSPQSKAAQLFRLKSSHEAVMTSEKLQTCPFGELVHYLRILRGVTQQELAVAIGVRRETIAEWETGKNPRKGVEEFINWLVLSEDSILERLIHLKAVSSFPSLLPEMISAVVGQREKYLFTNSIRMMIHYRPTAEDSYYVRAYTPQS